MLATRLILSGILSWGLVHSFWFQIILRKHLILAGIVHWDVLYLSVYIMFGKSLILVGILHQGIFHFGGLSSMRKSSNFVWHPNSGFVAFWLA